MTVSVVIPTYRRPGFLRETLESVWAQTRLPDEILIGDDSLDDETERLVLETLSPKSPVPMRYFHNKPPLKEGKNVDTLYRAAKCSHILHLHDDDPVLPRCLEYLTDALARYPQAVAAFGLQYITDEHGVRLKPESERTNRTYFRTKEHEGLVDGFFAGAVSMFPNNGFLIDAAAARRVGYDAKGDAGSAVDYYFGHRFGQLRLPMVFVNRYTATVRMTPGSESRVATADNAYQRMSFLMTNLRYSDLNPETLASIRHHLPFAIANAASLGKPGTGWKWFFSPYFRRLLFTPKGVKCAIRLSIASLRASLRPR